MSNLPDKALKAIQDATQCWQICGPDPGHPPCTCRKARDAAIDLVLEEAARVVRRMPSPSSEWMADELLRALGGPAKQIPNAIRALKSGNDS